MKPGYRQRLMLLELVSPPLMISGQTGSAEKTPITNNKTSE
jgi:hypothetical protein